MRSLVFFVVLSIGTMAFAEPPFVRGVTVSCQTSGTEWATPEMAATLDQLKTMGATAIAIHPYAQIQTDGSLRFSKEAAPAQITKPLDWAKEKNLQVMLVPHIAYWGTPFTWRGEIDFKSSVEWDRFFADYETWIVAVARLAEEHHAGIFSIGLEYVHAQKFEARWRRMIGEIRKVYHGKITYGANWDHFEDVPFWDAVDYIGILAYFPLSSSTDPTPAQLADGWRGWMKKLEPLSKKYGKQILFTEVGYNDNERAACEPWDFQRTGGSTGAVVQARCLDSALLLEKQYPFLAGLFLWKWFPDLPQTERETFDLRTPALKQTIANRWKP